MSLWPFLLYFILVIGIAAGMLVASFLLGQRHSERATGAPYEGGIVSAGAAHGRFSLRFYLVAMFFVIFDLEAVFIFSWAIAGRELGWQGYWEVLFFIGILVVTLAYLWRSGGLDWNVEGHRP